MSFQGRPQRHGHCTHTHSSRTYKTWDAMRRRCKDSENKYYGLRGIGVCERWQKFDNFLEDMGCRPPGMTLDRKDPNIGYCKDNCIWTTAAGQMHNRRDNKLSWEKVREIKHLRTEGFSQKEIAMKFGVNQSHISRILRGHCWKEG